MKVALYILGMLIRYGSQHGYAIKQLISEDAEHFANIKLPTIYYHLEKLLKEELVSMSQEQSGNRPDRSVFSITSKGKKQFYNILRETLEVEYRSEFSIDGVFYFGDFIDHEKELQGKLSEGLLNRREKIDHKLAKMKEHRNEIYQRIPKDMHVFVDIILSHHLLHCETEKKWVNETLKLVEKRWQAARKH